MSHFDFNCHSSGSITVSFRCKQCQEQVHSDELEISGPDYSGENTRDCTVESEGDAYCSNCDMNYEIRMFSSLGGGWGDVLGLGDNSHVVVDEEMSSSEREEYLTSISDSSQLIVLVNTLRFVVGVTNENRSKNDEFSICVMLHLHCVAALERYLASRLIALVLNDKKILRKFVEHDKKLRERTFKLSDIFDKHERIAEIVAKRLDEILFHRVSDVRGLYMSTLGINLGDLRWFEQAVIIRHHCAHRAGVDRNGSKVTVNYQSVRKLNENCLSLAKHVEQQAPLSDVNA